MKGLILVGMHPFLGSCLCQWVCWLSEWMCHSYCGSRIIILCPLANLTATMLKFLSAQNWKHAFFLPLAKAGVLSKLKKCRLDAEFPFISSTWMRNAKLRSLTVLYLTVQKNTLIPQEDPSQSSINQFLQQNNFFFSFLFPFHVNCARFSGNIFMEIWYSVKA